MKIKKLIEKTKEFFTTSKVKYDYKALYEEQLRKSEVMEFRYNRLRRKLMEICDVMEENYGNNNETKV